MPDTAHQRAIAKAIGDELRGIVTRPGREPGAVPTIDGPQDLPKLDTLKLLGLAFSGGGIRNATFNLGVLQALDRLGLLKYVDYLSTVSGGGYIGSAYLACLHEDGKQRQRQSTLWTAGTQAEAATKRQRTATAHLRRYSQYLAPQGGFFSADTWTIASIWLRNTLLLQAMLVSLFALTLLAPRIFAWVFVTVPDGMALAISGPCFAVSVGFIVLGLRRVSPGGELPPQPPDALAPRPEGATAGAVPPDGAQSPASGWMRMFWGRIHDQASVQVLVVLPALVGSACLASALWGITETTADGGWSPIGPMPGWVLLPLAGLAVAASTALTARISLLPGCRAQPWWWPGVVLIGLACGVLFTGLAWAVATLFESWHPTLGGSWGAGAWLAGMIGSPVLLASLGLCVVLQIGLLGRAIDDASREWWGRMGAFLGIYSLAPLVVSVTAVFGPQVVTLATSDTVSQWIGGSLTAGGVFTVVSGLLAGRSADTGGHGGSGGQERLAAAAPYVFIAGIMILVATGLDRLLALSDCAPGTGGVRDAWTAMDCSIGAGLPWLWTVAIANGLLLILLAWRIDINEASLNPFYRNRLVRCYLGAARSNNDPPNQRRPNAFTGFDAMDDFGLAALQPTRGYAGPVPIVNAALNLPGGDDAGLQERRASSFFFTPYSSGSAVTGVVNTRDISRHSDGIRLGACIATSGAAASPNMGYHTSAPVAFLLTFFNVWLGTWIRNPRQGRGRQNARWGLYYLLKELFATAGASDKYINLSDGGHFENLGVYELVRRRCRYIIACDAEEDGDMVLQALGGVVRKCRIDFGVEIDIDTSEIRSRDENGFSRTHCAVGRIRYPKAPAGDASTSGEPQYESGFLIYLKSSLTGDEGSDVLQYKAEHGAFPHESTADQFFSESQFESYRALGQHITETTFRPVGKLQPAKDGSGFTRAIPQTLSARAEMEEWLLRMEKSWGPVSPFTAGNFSRHAERLTEIWNAVRGDQELAFLDAELFPGSTHVGALETPPTTAGTRKGAFLCLSLIQLMENVYVDLNLESAFDHPDNEGWNKLFTRWALSPVLRATYTGAKATFGTRFQSFCERELTLT